METNNQANPIDTAQACGKRKLKPGWLNRQADLARKDIAKWPKWLKAEMARMHPK